MPGKHSAKQKRQVKHIIAGYKKRGASEEEAKRIGWATVNKAGGLGMGASVVVHQEKHPHGTYTVKQHGRGHSGHSVMFHPKVGKPEQLVEYTKKLTSAKRQIALHVAKQAKKSLTPCGPFAVQSLDEYHKSLTMLEKAWEHSPVSGEHTMEKPHGTYTVHPPNQHHQGWHVRYQKKNSTIRKRIGSSFASHTQAKAFAMTHHRAVGAKHTKKSLTEDTMGDLRKSGEGSRGGKIIGHTKSGKPIYGVKHHTKAVVASENLTVKRGTDDHKLARGVEKLITDHIARHKNFSSQDHKDAAQAHYKEAERVEPKTGDGLFGPGERKWWMADWMADHHRTVGEHHLHEAKKMIAEHHAKTKSKMKSFTEDTMSDKYEDLFKSELSIEEDKVLIECPHCEHPITKSEVLEKARKKKGAKGSIVKDNKDGGHHAGPESGHNTTTPVRSAGAAKRIDADNPGMHAKKSEDEEEETADDVTKASTATAGPILGGSRHVMYMRGDDEEIAKAIAEGTLGQGALVRPPLDARRG